MTPHTITAWWLLFLSPSALVLQEVLAGATGLPALPAAVVPSLVGAAAIGCVLLTSFADWPWDERVKVGFLTPWAFAFQFILSGCLGFLWTGFSGMD